MRRTEPRLIDPAAGHERVLLTRYGVKAPRELDDETRASFEQLVSPSAIRPRVTGSHCDGSAARSLAEVLARLGIIEDETDYDPEPLPGTYRLNESIRVEGASPTYTGPLANNGYTAAVVGTGFAITLNDATDVSGRVTLVTGTGVSAAGTGANVGLVRIVFNRPNATGNYAVLLSAADSDAAGQGVYSNYSDRSTTDFIISCTTVLNSSTSYHWDYMVIERKAL